MDNTTRMEKNQPQSESGRSIDCEPTLTTNCNKEEQQIKNLGEKSDGETGASDSNKTGEISSNQLIDGDLDTKMVTKTGHEYELESNNKIIGTKSDSINRKRPHPNCDQCPEVAAVDDTRNAVPIAKVIFKPCGQLSQREKGEELKEEKSTNEASASKRNQVQTIQSVEDRILKRIDGLEKARSIAVKSGNRINRRLQNPSTVTQSAVITNGQAVALPCPTQFLSNWKYEKLQELLIATKGEGNDQPFKFSHIIKSGNAANFTMEDITSLSQFLMGRLISQYRRLNSLKNFSRDDQIKIFQTRLPDLMVVQQSVKYDPQRSLLDVGYPGQRYVHADIGKIRSGEAFPKIMKLKTTFPNQLRSNEMVMLILSAMAMCDLIYTDIRKEIRDRMDSERLMYLDVLKEYLDSITDEKTATSLFQYLATWVNLVRLTLNTAGNRADLNPHIMEVIEKIDNPQEP